MSKGPIDFDSPLGISKKEWTRVLGVNLALLLIVYVVALVFTLCGSDFFLLNFYSDDLQRIEETLRSWNVYPLIPMAFSTFEVSIVSSYVAKKIVKWWYAVAHFGLCVSLNLIFMNTIGFIPPYVATVLFFVFCAASPFFLCAFQRHHVHAF